METVTETGFTIKDEEPMTTHRMLTFTQDHWNDWHGKCTCGHVAQGVKVSVMARMSRHLTDYRQNSNR